MRPESVRVRSRMHNALQRCRRRRESPAPAGMDRREHRNPRPEEREPRASGDGPTTRQGRTLPQACLPGGGPFGVGVAGGDDGPAGPPLRPACRAAGSQGRWVVSVSGAVVRLAPAHVPVPGEAALEPRLQGRPPLPLLISGKSTLYRPVQGRLPRDQRGPPAGPAGGPDGAARGPVPDHPGPRRPAARQERASGVPAGPSSPPTTRTARSPPPGKQARASTRLSSPPPATPAPNGPPPGRSPGAGHPPGRRTASIRVRCRCRRMP